MRLKIELRKKGFKIPISYQSILQGFIYNTFQKEELGAFYHNEGYRLNEKNFKMFVFSNLFGDYIIENKELIFNDHFRFYLSSYDEKFIEAFYNFLLMNNKIVLNNQMVDIYKIELDELQCFSGTKTVKIKTLSPVVAYQTEGKYVHYYKPSDKNFEQLIFNNLIRKNAAYYSHIEDLKFKIESVQFEKERVVKFKNTFYVAYVSGLTLNVNFDTLKLIYDTGLSSKGPSGFGMIELVK